MVDYLLQIGRNSNFTIRFIAITVKDKRSYQFYSDGNVLLLKFTYESSNDEYVGPKSAQSTLIKFKENSTDDMGATLQTVMGAIANLTLKVDEIGRKHKRMTQLAC